MQNHNISLKLTIKGSAILFLILANNAFCWKISFHNFSKTEDVHFSVDTSQSYPCGGGSWYQFGINSCNCGPGKNVKANSSEDYHFDGVCVGACTTKIYTNKGVSVNFLGGLGACSDIEVWTGQDKENKWYIFATDWTNGFIDFFKKDLPTFLTGFNFDDLISNGKSAASNAGKISGMIKGSIAEINKPTGPIAIANQVMDKVNDFKKKAEVIINQTKIDIKDLEKNASQLSGPNSSTAAANLMSKVKEDVSNASTLIDQLLTTISELTKTINQLDLKPILKSLNDTLEVIRDLVKNVRGIINAMPDFLLNHDALGPLDNITTDLNNIIDNIDQLQNASLYKVEELLPKLISGLLENFDKIDVMIANVKKAIAAINDNIPKLNDALSGKKTNQYQFNVSASRQYEGSSPRANANQLKFLNQSGQGFSGYALDNNHNILGGKFDVNNQYGFQVINISSGAAYFRLDYNPGNGDSGSSYSNTYNDSKQPNNTADIQIFPNTTYVVTSGKTTQLTGRSITASAAVIGTTLAGAKDRILNQLQTPENIALLLPEIFPVLIFVGITVLTAGTADPFLAAPVIRLMFEILKPVLKNIVPPVLRDAKFEDLVGGLNDLVAALAKIVSGAVTAINDFNDLSIELMPKNTLELLNKLSSNFNKLSSHVSDLNKINLIK